ncbi:MAG: hypothetical protein WCA84_20635 [Ignavibacteriaceae bacterium]|jgi:hypothetical protein
MENKLWLTSSIPQGLQQIYDVEVTVSKLRSVEIHAHEFYSVIKGKGKYGFCK